MATLVGSIGRSAVARALALPPLALPPLAASASSSDQLVTLLQEKDLINLDALGDNFESVGDAILSNFGVVWAVICAGIYLSIYLQGASNVFYRNGTTYDGTTPIAQPFKRTTEETAKLAFNATLINAEDEAL